MIFHIGQTVRVPCEISEGAFQGENLVTIDAENGPISGFVREDSIAYDDAHRAYLTGVIEGVEDEVLIVRLRGSFFTTTGIAKFAQSRLAAA